VKIIKGRRNKKKELSMETVKRRPRVFNDTSPQFKADALNADGFT
jgi:hypothetical protein